MAILSFGNKRLRSVGGVLDFPLPSENPAISKM